MSHALATVLHRGRKAASNVISACLASSWRARCEKRAPQRSIALSDRRSGYPFALTLAQVSRRVTARLMTGFSGVASGSTQK